MKDIEEMKETMEELTEEEEKELVGGAGKSKIRYCNRSTTWYVYDEKSKKFIPKGAALAKGTKVTIITYSTHKDPQNGVQGVSTKGTPLTKVKVDGRGEGYVPYVCIANQYTDPTQKLTDTKIS